MLFFLTLIASLVVLGAMFGIFNPKNYVTVTTKDNGRYGTSTDESVNTKQVVKLVGVILISVVIAMINPLSVNRIDAGNVGLKIDKVGNSKGIPVAIPVKGWVFYNSWVSDIVEYSIRQQHVQYEGFDVTTKGGFNIKVSPSFNFSLKPERAADVYINLLKGGSFSSLEDNWIKTATTIAFNNATNKYTIDSIFNNREHYQQDIIKELNKEMSAYFTVSQINPGVIPPPELANVIKQKTETIQKAQQAELDRITAENEALTKIATARGDSAQAVIQAAGRAEAIRREQQTLTPLYIDYIKVQKWNGSVPTTVLGSNGNVLLNLPH